MKLYGLQTTQEQGIIRFNKIKRNEYESIHGFNCKGIFE